MKAKGRLTLIVMIMLLLAGSTIVNSFSKNAKERAVDNFLQEKINNLVGDLVDKYDDLEITNIELDETRNEIKGYLKLNILNKGDEKLNMEEINKTIATRINETLGQDISHITILWTREDLKEEDSKLIIYSYSYELKGKHGIVLEESYVDKVLN